jgi:integrase
VKVTLQGIRRTIGAGGKPKAPAIAEVTLGMAKAAPEGLKGLQDRALLLLGFGGAFRRSELVALDVSDVTFEDDGLRVTIRRSKTNQEQKAVTIAIIRGQTDYCPMKALRAWLDAAGVTEGAIFRQVRKGGCVLPERLSAAAVCDLVKASAGKLGLDPAAYGAHSLRAGFLTSAARNGASVFKMRDVSRHKSLDVPSGYIRDAKLFEDHAGKGLY